MQNLTETKPITFRFTKEETQTYKMRNTETDLEWADFTLDCQEKAGRVTIASAYGSWTVYWSSCGKPFKEFLLDVTCAYMASRFKQDGWFNAEATVADYKYELKDCLEGEYIAQEIYDAIMVELDSLDTHDSEREFWEKCYRLKALRQYYVGTGAINYEPRLIYTVTPQFKSFWKTNWLPFMDVLKGELSLNQA